MSLHSIVSGLSGRAAPAGTSVARASRPGRAHVAVLLHRPSMRLLEAGLAIVAIGTAFLLGLGH